MAIPRLQEATNSFTFSTTINKRLRPYLQDWYADTKNDGETIEQFVLRVLKTNARQHYVGKFAKGLQTEIEVAQQAATELIQADITTLDEALD